jgi:hypothetical protein
MEGLMRALATLSSLVAILSYALIAGAEVPQVINYQGRLTTAAGAPVTDGDYAVRFAIYDDSLAGTALWAETLQVATTEGLFAVQLGNVHPIQPVVFSSEGRWLAIAVDSDPEITPRTRFTSVAYAFQSAMAADSDWMINGDDIYKLTGKAGLGTDTPAVRLDVIETNPVNSVARFKAAAAQELRVQYEDSQGGYGYIGKSDYDLAGFQFLNKDQGNAVNIVSDEGDINLRVHPHEGATWEDSTLTKLHVDGNTGNVGIGTINPNSKLSIYQDGDGVASIDLYTSNVIYGQGAGVTLSEINFGGLDFAVSKAAISAYGDYYSDMLGLQFKTSTNSEKRVPRMTITPTGDVGIGTTTPSARLDVAGAINATTYYGDGSHLTGIAGTTDNDWTINGNTIYHETGNVGIGTSSPATALDVSGAVNVSGPGGSTNAITASTSGTYSAVGALQSGTGPGLYAESQSTQSIVGAVTGKAKADGGSAIYGETWSAGVEGGSSVAVFGWAPSTSQSVGGAALGVLGRVNSYTLPSAGAVPVGVFGEAMSSTGISWAVNGDAYGTDAGCAAVHGKMMNGSAQGRAIWGEAPSSGYAGYFQGNLCYTGTFGSCSDIRYKTSIRPLDSALDKVLGLRGVTYKWRTTEFPDRNFPDGWQIGLIAQETQKVLPEVVSKDADGYLTIDYARLTAVLVEAVKTLNEENNSLRKELAEIKETLTEQQASR